MFSLHYCYVKITIFHPVVSKIKLRFYLKPGNREPMFECWDESGSEHPDVGMRAAANIRIVPDAPSPFPSPQDPGLLDNQSLLCIHSLTVNREAILEDQRFLKKYFPRQGSFIHTTYIWEGPALSGCSLPLSSQHSNMGSRLPGFK